MLKTLINLKKSLEAAQEMHRIKENKEIWDNGTSIYEWPDRAICETMHNFTNCMNYFGKKQEALIYAV